MAFVKLDCKILDSTLWIDRSCREVFITALLMAEPKELLNDTPTLMIQSLEMTDFIIPPGWYGFIPAAGSGIIRRAMIDNNTGIDALEKLSLPDSESRSAAFDGRRLVRIDGGFIILNFIKYRDRDSTAAERQQRYRQRKNTSNAVTDNGNTVRPRNITQLRVRVQNNIIPPLSPKGENDVLSDKKLPIEKSEKKIKNNFESPESAPIPDDLNTEQFRAVWLTEWLPYRSALKLKAKFTAHTAKLQLARLLPFGPEWAIDRIHRAIESGWQGLVFDNDRPAEEESWNSPMGKILGTRPCTEEEAIEFMKDQHDG